MIGPGADDEDILDLLPEGVVLLDGDGRVTRHNRRAVHLLGLHEATGEEFDEVVTLVDEHDETCVGLGRARPGGADRLPERLLYADLGNGHRRPLAVSGSWTGDGRTVLTFRQAGRRKQLDAARSDLVATVSHEIRSPLTSVKGFTRTLLLKWERFSDEQKRAMLETINVDADRVTRLLTELLDVSRIDADRVQLRPTRIDFDDLVARVVRRATQDPEANGRQVDVSVPSDLPTVLADEDKVEQILTNLVENALRYAPASPVRVQVSTDTDTLEVRVRDEGPGIPPDQVGRIFQKFGRGRDNRRSGTGLGLYISRGLARAHGGDVACEATTGAGSTFVLRLPLPDARAGRR